VTLGDGAAGASGSAGTDWSAWHDDYADAGSQLSGRLAVVQSAIRGVLAEQAARAGPLTVLSVCAGDGRDILGVLAEQEPRLARRVDVTLLETDPRNRERAEGFCRDTGLSRVRLRDSDAGLSSSYVDAAPAELVLICGMFGNLTDAGVCRLIQFLPALCRSGATLIWTRSRRAPDLTPSIRDWLAAARFTELSFTAPPDVLFSVGVHRFDGEPPPLASGQRLFTFVR
jgi:hypothetical protein